MALTLLALALAAGVALATRASRPLPPLLVLGHIPTFHLVDEHAAPFTAESMAGHVNVVDFIFTHCTSSCPHLTATMADLQSRLSRARSGAHLVSFSVDPENDTPPVLAAYADRAKADPSRWTFLTGPPDDVERAVVFGFKISAAKITRDAGDYDVTHGNWLVLVDDHGAIRGYYPVDTADDEGALFRDVLRLEHEHS